MNAAVRAKTASVLDEARRVLAYMPGDDDYLWSFAAGARARSDSWSTCEAMLDATFYVSGSGGKSSRGWADGQHVAWANHLAHELQECYLEDETERQDSPSSAPRRPFSFIHSGLSLER